MARVISLDSEEGKELARWDRPKSQGGMRPDSFEAFPKMLYRAQERAGRATLGDPSDEASMRACQRVVRDEYELRAAKNDGWRETPAEALEYHEYLKKGIADEAARRHFRDSKMSEAAQAEAAEADASTAEHLPVIPEKRRVGRPRKAEAAA